MFLTKFLKLTNFPLISPNPSSKLNKVDYHELSEPGIIINLIGVSLICLAILIPYIIRNLDIKRPFRSELDRHLKLSQLEMRI